MKRVFDVITSLFLLLMLFPLILIIILFLLFFYKKVFFIQQRVGKNNRHFYILKFKTMNEKKDNSGELLPDQQRLTYFGKFLRKTSIDEIPQLINVLKGDMSLVGPRPLLPEYIPLYSSQQARRHEVKPGITGWAQIKGRNAITWKERFEYDLWYVNNWSFGLDLKILWLTFLKIFQKNDGDILMEKFKGNDSISQFDNL